MRNKKLIGFGCFFYLWILFGAKIETGKDKEPFVFGVNGHPFTQHDYRSLTWAKQMDLLGKLGVDYYRVDVPLDGSGRVKNSVQFMQFLRLAEDTRVKLMPILKPIYENGKDSLTVYRQNVELGRNYAKVYGKLFDVIEVGNELELHIMKRNGVDGTKSAHYDFEKSKQLMWRLRGFIDGLKSVNPRVKVSLSLGWTHTYYLEILKQYQVPYDIIGYHWYSNMGDITKPKVPYQNLLPEIYRKYEKTIWLTEFNSHEGTGKHSVDYQEQYIRQSLLNIKKQGIVSGFFIYELLDEPALRQLPHETRYGLAYKSASDTSYRLKPAFDSFRSLIQTFKSK